MNFIAPDPLLMRRSEDGQYIIDKVAIPSEHPAADSVAPVYKYVLWQYVRTHWSFETSAEAVDEATSLQAAAVAEWDRQRAEQSAQEFEAGAVSAMPEAAPRPPEGAPE